MTKPSKDLLSRKFTSNEHFLVYAPVGTVFSFNDETVTWEKTREGWVASSTGNLMGNTYSWEEDKWRINVKVFPGDVESINWRTDEENRLIVSKLEQLLADCVSNTVDGKFTWSLYAPEEVNMNWIKSLLDCFPESER